MILEAGFIYFTICLVLAVLVAKEGEWLSAIAFLTSACLALAATFLLLASLNAIFSNILGPAVLGVIGLVITFFIALWTLAAFVGGLVALS